MQPTSPIFPASVLTLAPVSSNSEEPLLLPSLPDKPSASTSSVSVYLLPAEKNLYVQGFEPEEYSQRPPTLLRGCLLIRVSKPSKIRSITLTFKGQQRTDWPEGIPPKKVLYAETKDIVSHTWPFFQAGSVAPNNGADYYRELPKGGHNDGDVSHLNLGDTMARSASPMPSRERDASIGAASISGASGNFFTRNLSPASNFIRRAASPSVSSIDKEQAMNDLASVLSPEADSSKPGFFPPGDYVYNFEHPLRPSIPESCNVTFGSVLYYLEATISRPGTFKSNLSARMPINIIRTPSEQNLEENESIVITRDWEDQLRYDIVVGAKSIVLDSYLPLAFRFVPLWGKVALHRIRVYLTENLEYYCSNKKVHRMEPSRKYLLLEHKANKGKSLLSKNQDDDEEDNFDDVLPKELEFQVFVPKSLKGKNNHEIHPDTSYEDIQSHHWIKICLRISKQDPDTPGKRKHYEISIDSPLRVLSPLAAHGNTLLPAYDDFIPGTSDPRMPEYTTATPPLSPGVTPIDNTNSHASGLLGVFNKTPSSNNLDSVMQSTSPPPTPILHHINSSGSNDEPIERDADMHLEANLYKPNNDESSNMLSSPQAVPHPGTFNSPLNSPLQRPIHLLRRPSMNPPPFEADVAPPTFDTMPPPYEEEENSLSMSPLRIDVPISRSLDVPAGGAFPEALGSETPVKDSLQQQLRGKRKSALSQSSHSSHSSQRSQGSNESSQNGTNPASINANSESIAIPIPVSSSTTIDGCASIPISSEANSRRNPVAVSSSYSSTGPNDFSEDIVDYPSSPIRLPSSPLHLAASPLNLPSSPVHRAISPMRDTSAMSPPRVSSQYSRRSSTSSIESGGEVDMPIEQTMPLLSLSNSSVASATLNSTRNTSITNGFKERNSSLGSLIYDLSVRRTSHTGTTMGTSLVDLVDGESLTTDLFKINNLLQLRNPRIKKHYQDEDFSGTIQEEPKGDACSNDSTNTGDINNDASSNSTELTNNSTSDSGSENSTIDQEKVRQKSFGVVPSNYSENSEQYSNSSKDSSLIQETPFAASTNKIDNRDPILNGQSGVPGLKLGYIIE